MALTELAISQINQKVVRTNVVRHINASPIQYTVFEHITLCKAYYLDTHPSHIWKLLKKYFNVLLAKFCFYKTGY